MLNRDVFEILLLCELWLHTFQYASASCHFRHMECYSIVSRAFVCTIIERNLLKAIEVLNIKRAIHYKITPLRDVKTLFPLDKICYFGNNLRCWKLMLFYHIGANFFLPFACSKCTIMLSASDVCLAVFKLFLHWTTPSMLAHRTRRVLIVYHGQRAWGFKAPFHYTCKCWGRDGPSRAVGWA